jgi:hypothetical protein
VVSLATAADKPDAKSPYPGKATWDVRAFNLLFKVVDVSYDDKTGQVHWSLDTRDDYRLLDFVRELDKDRPFVFGFQNENGDELATIRMNAVDFKGIPRDKIIPKGTRLTLSLEVPTALDKSKFVVLRRKE